MKKLVLFITAIFSTYSSLTYAGWDQQLAKHHITANTIIFEQYEAYQAHHLPKIADPIIKAIPIHESGEALVDIALERNPRIKMLPNPKTPFESPDANSGFSSASKIRTSVYNKLNQLVKALDKIAPQFGFKAGQISIRVFEGLRDIETQNQLFNDKAKEIQLANPNFTPEEVIAETSKWVSPTLNNVPVHSTGAAVDIRLYDESTQTLLEMGKFGVIWGKNESAQTFSNNISDEIINNRLFLLVAAAEVGLINYPYEYWHFSAGDRYAAYWEHLKQAVYNKVE